MGYQRWTRPDPLDNNRKDVVHRAVPGFDGAVEVTEAGDIWQNDPNPKRTGYVDRRPSGDRYWRVNGKLYSDVCLVAMMFLPPSTFEFKRLLYKDGNRDHIHVANLEWVEREPDSWERARLKNKI